MTGALNAVRRNVIELLEECGLRSVAAMEPDSRKSWNGPVAAVSIQKVVCAPGGFQDYLGTRENKETGRQDELYGRAVEVTLGLDLYAPRNGGERVCRRALETVMETLVCRDVAGLTLRNVESGPVDFLEREGLYHLPVSCRCSGWMVAATDGSGSFMDFEVKGRRI